MSDLTSMCKRDTNWKCGYYARKHTALKSLYTRYFFFFFFFQLSLQNSTFRHKHTQNWWQKQGGGQHLLSPHHHGGGMCRGWLTAWPEIIESWIRLCLGVRRHIWVMTERERQRERERGLQETKTEDKQSQVRHTLVPHSQSRWQSDCQQLWSQPELEINPELRPWWQQQQQQHRGDTLLLSL